MRNTEWKQYLREGGVIVDNLALYNIDYFSFLNDDGICHILQAAILAEYYMPIRKQLVEAIGEEKISKVENDFSGSLELIKSLM